MIGITTINSLSQFTTMLSPRLNRQLLKESHHATLLCAQTNATFNPLRQYPVEKLVCLSWDSTDLPICHSSTRLCKKEQLVGNQTPMDFIGYFLSQCLNSADGAFLS